MIEEREFWAKLVRELQEIFTLERIAEEIGLSVRQVSNIKDGDKPKGLAAVKLHRFHAEHRTQVHGICGESQ